MLNEEGKFHLRRAVNASSAKTLDKARADGPVKVIQEIIDIGTNNRHLSEGAFEAAMHLDR